MSDFDLVMLREYNRIRKHGTFNCHARPIKREELSRNELGQLTTGNCRLVDALGHHLDNEDELDRIIVVRSDFSIQCRKGG